MSTSMKNPNPPIVLEFQGRSLTTYEWEKEVGIKAATIRARLSKGWSVERALKTPLIDPVVHGAARRSRWTAEYKIWRGIKVRCSNPNLQERWKKYGGRGISICEEWRNDFAAFFAHVGLRPSPKHSIERVCNDGDYEPGNVRWATAQEQARNRRTTLKLTWRETTKSAAEWANFVGIPTYLLYSRLKRGWTIERSLTEPVHNSGRIAKSERYLRGS
jgi:hypothetical protein